jgi:16S rRNA (guanine966-N2)-methyltransferase
MTRKNPGGRKTAMPPAGSSGRRHVVRIIGGEWRGRKVRFPPVDAIRPTPDRVRETVFNWLQPVVAGSRCLDLYAGSGALGLEALSRGAREVVFVDLDASVTRHLEQQLREFGCDRGQVVRMPAERYLEQPAAPFDVVFLDPPYASGLAAETLLRIAGTGWVAPDGCVYIETAASSGPPALPQGWTLFRSKRAGEVGYHLARRTPAGEP